MPNTNQSIRARHQEAQKRQKRYLTIAFAGILIIVLAFAAWLFMENSKSAVPALDPNAVPTLEPTATEGPTPTIDPNYTPMPEPKVYASAPEMMIDTTKQYYAMVKLAKGGEFVIQLFADKAPITVNNFVFLASDGYYDGVTFHRVLEGFMAQGGDPTGTGMGGPGYQFKNEDSDLKFDKAGMVAMANAGRDTNGSQFFITFGPTDWLDGGYTIFGQVIEGMEVVNGLTRRDPDAKPTFTGDVIESITIVVK